MWFKTFYSQTSQRDKLKSEEAKYYDFGVEVDSGVMLGPCEFIHRAFYCQKCSQNIVLVTQINQENIYILIESVQKHFNNKGKNVSIKKCFENINNEVVDDYSISSINNLYLIIEENDMNTLIYKIPISRKKNWGRNYYFKIK